MRRASSVLAVLAAALALTQACGGGAGRTQSQRDADVERGVRVTAAPGRHVRVRRANNGPVTGVTSTDPAFLVDGTIEADGWDGRR